MRKIVAVAFVLLAFTGMLFAGEGRIGVTIAPDWMWYSNPEDTGKMDFNLMAEGANYFGKEGGFGIEYGLGVKFPVNTWITDNDPQKVEDGKSSFIFKVGAGYKHAFSDMFGLTAGLGIRGSVLTTDGSFDLGGIIGVSGKATAFMMDIYGSVAADITLLDFLSLQAGVSVGGPVVSSCRITTEGSIGEIGGGGTETVDLDLSGFYLAPFVGVSFVY